MKARIIILYKLGTQLSSLSFIGNQLILAMKRPSSITDVFSETCNIIIIYRCLFSSMCNSSSYSDDMYYWGMAKLIQIHAHILRLTE